tara:strand:+ start:473 stop:778 length:306 start_codon:yes stop_codon:yes gene_type:complete
MPKSKQSTMFYDAEFTWTCGVCKQALRNKNSRGINMMKKLHFRANPDCKNKSHPEEVKRKLQPSGHTCLNGSYHETVKQDTINTLTKLNIENLTVHHEGKE